MEEPEIVHALNSILLCKCQYLNPRGDRKHPCAIHLKARPTLTHFFQLESTS